MIHARSLFDDLHADTGSHRRRRFARDFAFLIVRIVFVALLGTLIYSIAASAAEPSNRVVQPLEAIRTAAETYVRDAAAANLPADAQLIAIAGELDSRLQLTNCSHALRTFTLNGATLGARNTIGVRCNDPAAGAWTVYVPVALQTEMPVLVLRRSLPRDAHIGSDDVDAEKRRVAGLGTSYPTSVGALREQHLKRAAQSGTVLSSDMLTRDLQVKRGQEVFLEFSVAGLAVRAPGVALADGGIADRIRVQNRTSLKVVEGTIESGNLVRVGM